MSASTAMVFPGILLSSDPDYKVLKQAP